MGLKKLALVLGLFVLMSACSFDGPKQVQETSLQPLWTGWDSLADFPDAIFEGQGVVANGDTYVFGGFFSQTTGTPGANIQVTNKVYRKSAAGTPVVLTTNYPSYVADTHAGVAAIGSKVYLAGGLVGNYKGSAVYPQCNSTESVQPCVTNNVAVFNTSNNTWSENEVPNLPLPSGVSTGVVAGAMRAIQRTVNGVTYNELHFFGGVDGNRNGTSATSSRHLMLRFDSTPTWEVLNTDFPILNHFGVAATTFTQGVGGPELWAIGGQTNYTSGSEASPLAKVYRYRFSTNQWDYVTALPYALGHTTYSTIVYLGRYIKVFGGSTTGIDPVNKVLTIDAGSNPVTVSSSSGQTTPRYRGSAIVGLTTEGWYYGTGRCDSDTPSCASAGAQPGDITAWDDMYGSIGY